MGVVGMRLLAAAYMMMTTSAVNTQRFHELFRIFFSRLENYSGSSHHSQRALQGDTTVVASATNDNRKTRETTVGLDIHFTQKLILVTTRTSCRHRNGGNDGKNSSNKRSST